MRITNNMIMGNTKTNINSTKVLVDKYNTQMTTQKKISKASEDPVIAIRSLRLSTSLSHLDQYKDNNIPDASSWMDVTQTALSNMKITPHRYPYTVCKTALQIRSQLMSETLYYSSLQRCQSRCIQRAMQTTQEERYLRATAHHQSSHSRRTQRAHIR